MLSADSSGRVDAGNASSQAHNLANLTKAAAIAEAETVASRIIVVVDAARTCKTLLLRCMTVTDWTRQDRLKE